MIQEETHIQLAAAGQIPLAQLQQLPATSHALPACMKELASEGVQH